MTVGLTSQAAADKIGSLYDMILIAAERTRELRRGHAPKLASKHTPCVIALQEIEAGLVGNEYLEKIRNKK